MPLFDGEEAVAALAGPRLPSYIRGHRKRLRERFCEGGATAMPDYELLELILFRSFRNGDVIPTVVWSDSFFWFPNRRLSESLVHRKGKFYG